MNRSSEVNATQYPGVPDDVIEIAHQVMAGMDAFGIEETVERKDLARRLLVDPQMPSVWKYILRPHPKRGYFYPVDPEILNPFSARGLGDFKRAAVMLNKLGDDNSRREAEWLEGQIVLNKQFGIFSNKVVRRLTPAQRQQWACRSVYMSAFTAGALVKSVRTAPELLAASTLKREVAIHLKEISALASQLLHRVIDVEEFVSELEKQSKYDLLRQDDELLVARQRGDGAFRALIIRLHATMIDHFGTHLYGQIAKIANVITDRSDITHSKIREMLRP